MLSGNLVINQTENSALLFYGLKRQSCLLQIIYLDLLLASKLNKGA